MTDRESTAVNLYVYIHRLGIQSVRMYVRTHAQFSVLRMCVANTMWQLHCGGCKGTCMKHTV